ncbi:MAG: efflux RND transporter periplasmic adaptor subunit, partial [Prevotella sp.]|nr:efflux RND transporter periplasmic adaptor subunit [Prevotella sp.]
MKSIFALSFAGVLFCGCSGGGGEKGDASPAVNVFKAVEAGVSESIVYSGTIEAVSGTSLSFSTAGTLATLPVSEGMTVGAGEVLATLDGNNQMNMLLSARSSTTIARESLSQMEDTYARMSTLHAGGSLSEMQWIEVETRLAQAQAAVRAAEAQEAIAEKGVSDTRLTAPFAGFISSKTADVGQQVVPGMAIVKLVSIDKVKATFGVGEGEVSSLSIGEAMSVTVSSLDGAVFTGVITDKSVSADPVSRSYSVSVTIDNKEKRLLPGMICEVAKAVGEGGKSIVIPSRVVQIDEKNSRYVWCVMGGKAARRY